MCRVNGSTLRPSATIMNGTRCTIRPAIEPQLEGADLQQLKAGRVLELHHRGLVAGQHQGVFGVEICDQAVVILLLIVLAARSDQIVEYRDAYLEFPGGRLALLVVFEFRQPRQSLDRS